MQTSVRHASLMVDAALIAESDERGDAPREGAGFRAYFGWTVMALVLGLGSLAQLLPAGWFGMQVGW